MELLYLPILLIIRHKFSYTLHIYADVNESWFFCFFSQFVNEYCVIGVRACENKICYASKMKFIATSCFLKKSATSH